MPTRRCAKSILGLISFGWVSYWTSRSVKLPEASGEWLKSENMEDALRELFDRFGPDIMALTFKESLFIDNTNRPLIFFRWLPGMAKIDIPF